MKILNDGGILTQFLSGKDDAQNCDKIQNYDLISSPWSPVFRDYGCYQGKGLDYLRCHFHRYMATLELLRSESFVSILELGASFPYAFTLMLKHEFPEASILLSQNRDIFEFGRDSEERDTFSDISIKSLSTDRPDLNFQCARFNMEYEKWPFENCRFDIVLCMEIIEHLLQDPCFSFHEANRVLKEGGKLIVTTPNIACYESVANLLLCQSPYTYGIYSSHGPYGRHNREYVPREIVELGESSGFRTEILSTRDVYPLKMDISGTRKLLSDMNDGQTMRGQVIFYRGIKKMDPNLHYPASLFDFDPLIHRAEITIKHMDRKVKVQGLISLEINIINRGQYTWMHEGEDITRLGILLLDPQKRLLIRDFIRVNLTRDILPGKNIDLCCEVNGPDIPGNFILRFDMVHEYVCWFRDASPYSGFTDVDIEVLP